MDGLDYETFEKTFQRIWNDLLCLRLHLYFNEYPNASIDLEQLEVDWSMCQNRKRFTDELEQVRHLASQKGQGSVAAQLNKLLESFSGTRNADKDDLPDEQIYGKLKR
jgi:hypothetical protein